MSSIIYNKFIDILNESYLLLCKKNQSYNITTIRNSNNNIFNIEKVIDNQSLIIEELDSILQQSSYIKFLSLIQSKDVSLFVLNYVNNRDKPIILNNINKNNEILLTIDKLIFCIYHRIILSDEYKDMIKAINTFLQSDNYDALGVRKILNIVNDISKGYFEIDDVHNYIITSLSFTNISSLMNIISIVSDSNKNISSKIAIKLISIKPKNEFEDLMIDINVALEKVLENNSQIHPIIKNITNNNNNTGNTKKPFKAISLSSNRIKTKRSFPLLKKAEELFKEELKKKNENALVGSKLAQQSLLLLECLVDICYSLSIFLDVSFVLLSQTTLFTENGNKLSILCINMLSNFQQIYEIFLTNLEQYYKDKEVGQSLENLSLLCKKRIIKCVDILMRSTIHHLLNDDNNNNNKSNNSSDGATWIEEFQRQLDSQNNGYLLSDTTRFYKRTVWQLISLLTNDEIQTQYMLNALSTPNGLLCKSYMQGNIIENKIINSNDDDIQNMNNYHETLDTLLEFFPDYGKGFLLAVLSTYDFNVESTIEAIFTDNLPTKLAMMDRKTSLIKKGKDDNMSKVSSKGLGIFGLPDDEEFKRKQIERVRKMEQEREYDFMILEQEYADDYDDQYDHPEGALNISDGTGIDKISNKKKLNEQVKVDWDKRMADMKRLNRITKEEEDDQKFWEGMKNDNRTVRFIQSQQFYDDDLDDSNSNSNNNTDTSDDVKGSKGVTTSTTNQTILKSNLRVTAPTFQPSGRNNNSVNSNPQKKESNDTENSNTSSITKPGIPGPGRKKIADYRSKLFDRHRQKAKAVRKGTF